MLADADCISFVSVSAFSEAPSSGVITVRLCVRVCWIPKGTVHSTLHDGHSFSVESRILQKYNNRPEVARAEIVHQTTFKNTFVHTRFSRSIFRRKSFFLRRRLIPRLRSLRFLISLFAVLCFIEFLFRVCARTYLRTKDKFHLG